MAIVPVQSLGSLVQLKPTFQLCDIGGDQIQSGTNIFLFFINFGGTSCIITLSDQHSQAPAGASAFSPEIVVNVVGEDMIFVGPLSDRFSGVDGLSIVTYQTLSTDMQIAAVTLD